MIREEKSHTGQQSRASKRQNLPPMLCLLSVALFAQYLYVLDIPESKLVKERGKVKSMEKSLGKWRGEVVDR